MTREHQLYFGQTASIFTILGRFDLQPGSLSTSFSTWASVEEFDAGGQPVRRLDRAFTVERDKKFSFGEVTAQIEQRALEILGLGGRGWTIEHLHLSTIDKVLSIMAASSNKGVRRAETFSGEEYDKVISENLELVASAVTVAWTHAKQNDEFLAKMTAV